MKTIVAATDFSPVSINAVNFAADMAMALKAELVLLNAYSLPVSYDDGIILPVPVEELLTESEKDLEKVKHDLLQRTSGKILVETRPRMGNVTEELEDICNNISPFAVVIGVKGKTNAEETVFGSEALSIIRHLKFPVICIPPAKQYGTGIKKIGLACDFREVAETVPCEAILKFIKEFQAELHILNVDYKGRQFRFGTPEESFVVHQMFFNQQPEYHYIDSPDVEEGINSFVEKNQLDLLVVIPKKHKLLAKIFKPSRTKQLVNGSRVPLACIHG
jgi:nucleotide-binding universal stress UspA family protein